jgi:hypothetical protein
MTNIFCRIKNKEEVIDELLDSFRTEFWLEEHQWFVRCDWSPLINNTDALLYTLPYTFDKYNYYQPLCSKSTVPNDRTYWLYDRVHNLQHFYVRRPTNDLYLFRGIFPNIRALSINIPLIDDLWSRIPILHHLKSLDVVFIRDGDLVYSQLQTLFDRANHLYSLTIGINATVQVDFSKLKSTSIHQLSFLYKMLIYTQSFDRVNCTTLACSPLGLQCKILSIEVNNYTTVLDLIKQMPNLQSLTFRIKNIDEKSAYEELAIRLRTHLPSAFVFTRAIEKQYIIEILMDR